MLSATNIINIVNCYQVFICPNLLLLCNVSGIANRTTRCCTMALPIAVKSCKDTILAMMHCYRHEYQDIASPTFINLFNWLLLQAPHNILSLLQPPLPTPFAAPLTGYLLEYHVYDNTSTMELPALNTSYTLDSIPSGAVYNITVSALSNAGPSRNNPSVHFGEFNLPNGSFFTYFLLFACSCSIVTLSGNSRRLAPFLFIQCSHEC